ncbi:MAG: hypothetical protein FRX49_03850 [Trebouxia sp. A1-2]|nr:MAG: hypothetical protein FRX49_10992 [Trebouxia sp. A1-2]KAA6425998.1 MAG: hypothetical protein FRX49_03850 [Trebouxia sp. A1-2]
MALNCWALQEALTDQLQQLEGSQVSRKLSQQTAKSADSQEHHTCAACRIEGEVGSFNNEGGVDNVDASASGCKIALEGLLQQPAGADELLYCNGQDANKQIRMGVGVACTWPISVALAEGDVAEAHSAVADNDEARQAGGAGAGAAAGAGADWGKP